VCLQSINFLSFLNNAIWLSENDGKIQKLAARALRPRPALDDKIICSWNALTTTALADAYLAFGDKEYQQQALSTGEFIWKSFYDPKEGLSRLFNAKVKSPNSVQAFLDDYAYSGLAFIKLYQLSFDEKWLYRAKSLVDFTQRHFYDTTQQMIYYNRDTLIGRQLDFVYQVMPSSNSAMAFLLFHLGSYFSIQAYIDQAGNMRSRAFNQMQNDGVLTNYVNWSRLCNFEIIIPGKSTFHEPNLTRKIILKQKSNEKFRKQSCRHYRSSHGTWFSSR